MDRYLESFMLLKKTVFQTLLIRHLTLRVVETLAEVIYQLIVLGGITLMQRLRDEQIAS
jgi:hypothetical protein